MLVKNTNVKYVFGLDIGTRNMVGTVGYKTNNNRFVVVAQVMKEHETRAMIDGQIHDIAKVSKSIAEIKKELEKETGITLTEVCIAAAGRVLKTVRKTAEYEFGAETIVNEEHVYSLDMLGVEKAYEEIREKTSEDNIRYYCVGYSVVQYFLNGYAINILEEHKAMKIGVELIATFLPNEVVDGLYASVEKAGLSVANLTLEPIAAINVAIPEKFRLLNIALVDVGAGTSDISIAKSGSIQAFGMMPYAGDEITETIAAKYLVDFATAEKIKKQHNKKEIKFKDIMGMKVSITQAELRDTIDEVVSNITKSVADKIIELNGGRTVSAVFVVGGGGKIPDFTQKLAKDLGLANDRVALRGQEIMDNIDFEVTNIKKDSLLVTPIGICLNYYEQKNNFIPVTINGERIKLYDNDRLSVMDAALQLGLTNEFLFPKRGEELIFTVNGEKRMVRGEKGEAAVIFVNGMEANLSTHIETNDNIEIKESTAGAKAVYEIKNLPEYLGTITFNVNGNEITCKRFAHVNGSMVPDTYNIEQGDSVDILNYYKLGQVLEYMDLPYYNGIKVNHEIADEDYKIYENFKIEYDPANPIEGTYEDLETEEEAVSEEKPEEIEITVTVNGDTVTLKGKTGYLFVDILDVYPFDTSVIKGTGLVMTINGNEAMFADSINDGDVLRIYWGE